MIRSICEKLHLRPSDIWDPSTELAPLARLHLDYLTLIGRSELGSKTMHPDKARKYMEELERQKKIRKSQAQQNR